MLPFHPSILRYSVVEKVIITPRVDKLSDLSGLITVNMLEGNMRIGNLLQNNKKRIIPLLSDSSLTSPYQRQKAVCRCL